jgi:hypothetical protein
MMNTVTDQDAYLLRENTGTTGLVQTAQKVAEVLAHWDLPHLIVGGLAVQEHGYPRVTIDVDVVVPDILEAQEFLTADVSGPFGRLADSQDRLVDSRNRVEIDLLPGGKVLKHGCKVPFPNPVTVAGHIQFVTLPDLISLKLDSWNGSPLRRTKDKADVVELITRRNLPRELAVAEVVRGLYLELWDGLKAEA